LTGTLKTKEKIEVKCAKRSLEKKEILEGSEEWDVLHKKLTTTKFAAWASRQRLTIAQRS